MNVCIRFYSGTGNAARAAALAAAEFSSAGWTVDSRPVTRGMPDPRSGVEGADLLLVVFSALGFSPSATMHRWLKRAPRGAGRRAAVLCVCGSEYNAKGDYAPGWGGAAAFTASGMLSRRGWREAGLAEASYPVNWRQMVNPPERSRVAELLSRGDGATRAFASALAGGREPEPFPMSPGRALVRPVGVLFRALARRAMGSLFASAPSCTACGLCARSCPAGAIAMRHGVPVWSSRCDSCNRCVNLCPVGAVRTSDLLLWTHVALGVALAVAAFAVPLPASWPGLARALLRTAALVAGPVAQFGLIAPALSALGRARALRPLFARSFMKDHRRYLEPGFKP